MNRESFANHLRVIHESSVNHSCFSCEWVAVHPRAHRTTSRFGLALRSYLSRGAPPQRKNANACPSFVCYCAREKTCAAGGGGRKGTSGKEGGKWRCDDAASLLFLAPPAPPRLRPCRLLHAVHRPSVHKVEQGKRQNVGGAGSERGREKRGAHPPSSRRPLRTMLSRPRGLLPSERSCAQGRQQQHAQGQTRIRGGVPRGAKCTRKYRAATLCAAHAPLFIFRVLEGTLIALMEGTLPGSRGGESENETFTDDSRFIHGSLATPCRSAPVRPGRLSLVGLSLVTLCPSPSP